MLRFSVFFVAIFSCKSLTCGPATTEINGQCIPMCGQGTVYVNGQCIVSPQEKHNSVPEQKTNIRPTPKLTVEEPTPIRWEGNYEYIDCTEGTRFEHTYSLKISSSNGKLGAELVEDGAQTTGEPTYFDTETVGNQIKLYFNKGVSRHYVKRDSLSLSFELKDKKIITHWGSEFTGNCREEGTSNKYFYKI